ncbi:MAG: transcriptional repressor LexA [Lachnospiraceae bacterium]|nr:transcriptional repressor LexA [Lachnospiraceae bacterium]
MRKKEGLSAKQKEILDFIRSEILAKGYPPTVREIGEKVKLRSTSSVHAHLSTLEAGGYIRRDPSKPRTIEICTGEAYPERREMLNIPVVGQVAAGQPILAEQNIESYFPYPADELSPTQANLFMLEVKGDSMIQIGILNGDRLICQEAASVRNGELAVVLVEDSATVKRFYKENGHFRLQPENDEMEPIIVEDCRILGKPVALIRSFR